MPSYFNKPKCKDEDKPQEGLESAAEKPFRILVILKKVSGIDPVLVKLSNLTSYVQLDSHIVARLPSGTPWWKEVEYFQKREDSLLYTT